MDISTVQKRKFLNNLYKLYYSTGSKPSNEEIRKQFSNYFTVNTLGVPVEVDYELLQFAESLDPNLMNKMMADSILNLEVLYDCIFDNNNELFGVVNTLHNKLESLKRRRKKLEGKIDDILFENSNSAGYFFSFTDNFSDLESVDLSLTSAFVDVELGRVSIPRIITPYSSAIADQKVSSSNVSYNLRINGDTVESGQVEDSEFMFDGLNDTYWSRRVSTASLSVVNNEIIVPVPQGSPVSKVSGKLLTSSPVKVFLRLLPTDNTIAEKTYFQDSTSDYDTFSFVVPALNYSRISLLLVKSEPDIIKSSGSDPYVYDFGVRELLISSEYYDTRATLVSAPVSLPVEDNANLEISAVSIDVSDVKHEGSEINYYVAADVSDFSGVSDFNWVPIKPISSNAPKSDKVVNLTSSGYVSRFIFKGSSQLPLIPLSTNLESDVDSARNPVKLPNTDFESYRICALGLDETIIKPTLLTGINTFAHYARLHSQSSIDTEYYKSVEYWSEQIAPESQASVIRSVISDQLDKTFIPLTSQSSGVFFTRVLSGSSRSVTHTLIKSDLNYNLSVYLNGSLIADLPSGVLSDEVDWNFVSGVNDIEILYDKPINGYVSFVLMSGYTLSEYGIVFSENYKYLNNLEYMRRASSGKKVFTIIESRGRKELVASDYIDSKSLLRNYANPEDAITAVRYRADLIRHNNPLQTPAIDSVKMKFRHTT